MCRPKVVITARSFGRYSRQAYAILEQAGCAVAHRAGARPKRAEELLPLLKDADALIVGCDEVNAAVLAAAPRLRIVAKFGVGYDNIDVQAARGRGIHVTYTPGAVGDAVAELAMGLIVALARRIVVGDATVRAGRWDRPLSIGLGGKRLGIVGLGAIGKKLAVRACAFEMQILACDLKPDSDFARQHDVQYVSLEELLGQADVVSLHVPLTRGTMGLVGEDALRSMKPTALLINTARGELVDEDALVRALREGWIGGAALDVFRHEPPLDSGLLALPNVILTPHMGGDTPAAAESKGAMSAKDVVRVIQGLLPLYPVP